MIIAAIIAILMGGGVYLVMQRGMLRLIMGITLMSHAVNLLILAAGVGAWRMDPLMDRATPEQAADPLPQAFVLTAIVISMASTAVMLAMAALGRDDDTFGSDDVESASRRLRTLQTMGWKNYEEAKAHGGVVKEHEEKKLGANDYTEVHSTTDEDGPDEAAAQSADAAKSAGSASPTNKARANDQKGAQK